MQVIQSAEDWSEIKATEGEAEIHFNLQMPIHHCGYEDLPAHIKAEADMEDVYVRGPVYVGDSSMLDRHKELVDGQAIVDSWPSYQKNPVILFNHRKDYGTIGKMLEVKMGDWPGIDFPVPIGYAMIDGGEEKIARKIRKGLLRAFSIGFIAKAAVKECPTEGKDDDDCYIIFTEIDWIETSVVDIPASPGALFEVSKALVTKSWKEDKHIIAVTENEESYTVEFAKDEMGETEDEENEAEELLEIAPDHIKTDIPASLDDSQNSTEDSKSQIEEQLSELGRGFAASVLELWNNKPKSTQITSQCCEGDCSCSTKQAVDETVPLNSPVQQPLDIPNREAPIMTAEEIKTESPAPIAATVEATHELSALPKPVEVLVSVVEELGSIKSAIAALENRFTQSEAVDTLNATIEAKDAEITSLKAAEIESAKAAEFDAAVEARILEMGLTAAAPTPITQEAERKSAPAIEEPKERLTVTSLDPHIKSSPGVVGLQGWLETQLHNRGRN